MRDDHLRFHYTWADLAPVRGMIALVVAVQLVGLAVGALYPRFDDRFDSAWYGGAIVTFPAFVLGLAIQFKLNRPIILENKRMVWHMGLIAAALSAFALYMPVLGFGNEA